MKTKEDWVEETVDNLLCTISDDVDNVYGYGEQHLNLKDYVDFDTLGEDLWTLMCDAYDEMQDEKIILAWEEMGKDLQ